ncbi:MAG: hypothetical protein SGARI_005475 [Bacillariaceae sp.]
MDRRMMMGSLQGESKKFDFSKDSQDAPMSVRQTKAEAAAAIQDSGSSLDLDGSNDVLDGTAPVDAFAMLNSSSSNPPERGTVFSSSLLREPSQRFDFQPRSTHSTAMDSQDTIEECEESDEEEETESDGGSSGEVVETAEPAAQKPRSRRKGPSSSNKRQSIEAEVLNLLSNSPNMEEEDDSEHSLEEESSEKESENDVLEDKEEPPQYDEVDASSSSVTLS